MESLIGERLEHLFTTVEERFAAAGLSPEEAELACEHLEVTTVALLELITASRRLPREAQDDGEQ